MLKNKFFILIVIMMLPSVITAGVTVSGRAIKAEAAAGSGLSAIYVMEDASVCEIEYRAESGNVKFFRFGDTGTAYATEFSVGKQGEIYSFPADSNDCGYMITDGSLTTCFYAINYRNHKLDLQALTIDRGMNDCDRTALRLEGNAGPIYYYSVNARKMELSRDLELSYTTLEAREGNFVPAEKQVTISATDGLIYAYAPLCTTAFTLTGDKFTGEWGDRQRVESASDDATAVAAITMAIQQEGSQAADGILGGSAPSVITFSATLTDAAVFHEWQISDNPEFDNITLRYTEPEITLTFDRSGTSYVRLEAANSDGSCRYISEVYEVAIGESSLTCPNAFSPGSSPGVNDEWKVSYRSIVSFHCEIVNRWGVKVATLTHPSQGWDGKKGGKAVPSGVYYYVIKARGADGRQYNLAGDINILKSTTN